MRNQFSSAFSFDLAGPAVLRGPPVDSRLVGEAEPQVLGLGQQQVLDRRLTPNLVRTVKVPELCWWPDLRLVLLHRQ